MIDLVLFYLVACTLYMATFLGFAALILTMNNDM